MIFEQLTLHNVGPFLGHHAIDLSPPSPKRPLVLVGGLNGGGKTTILDALRLALYGRLSLDKAQSDASYEDHLTKSIHRSVDPQDGAAVTLTMSRVTEGTLETISVRRSFRLKGKHVREELEVRKNDAIDPALTDAWSEHAEAILPARLSRFFFFDGEKIEALADVDRSKEALRTAVVTLLGLDVVDQLTTDLLVLERRKRAEQKTSHDKSAIEALEREITTLRAARDDRVQARASAQSARDRADKALRDAESRYALRGGGAFERKESLERELYAKKQERARIEEALREEAEGVSPLLLIPGLIDTIGRDDAAEQTIHEARALSSALAAHDARALSVARAHGADASVIAALQSFFDVEERARAEQAKQTGYLALNAEARADLTAIQRTLAAEAKARAHKLIAAHDALTTAIDDLERRLTSAPEEDAIADLARARDLAIEARARAEHALGAAEAELERVKADLAHRETALAKRLDEAIDQHTETQTTARILTHAERARGTLARFREAVLNKRIQRIEALIAEGFQHLLRKESLITDLSIDPETFTLTLFGADKAPISPERLSAGERQILAVAILWALARASGRPLPVVIDTPLGRLDTIHRTRFVERYLPFASRQVIVLSTDEEIDQALFERVSPILGRSYILDHDDARGATTVKKGYFFQGGA